MGDQVRVEEQAVSNALGAWDDGARTLAAEFKAKAKAVVDQLGDGAWAGGDHPGREFLAALKIDQVAGLFGDGGDGDKVVDAVVDLGTNTRTAIDKSLGSDAAQAAEVKKPQQLL